MVKVEGSSSGNNQYLIGARIERERPAWVKNLRRTVGMSSLSSAFGPLV